MIKEIFIKQTKWSVMKNLIFKEIDDLIINSLGIVCFISFFVGGVVSIQTALNLTNPLIPTYLIGFATRQSVILEFAPTFISVIMAGKMGSFITSSKFFELSRFSKNNRLTNVSFFVWYQYVFRRFWRLDGCSLWWVYFKRKLYYWSTIGFYSFSHHLCLYQNYHFCDAFGYNSIVSRLLHERRRTRSR